MIDDYIPTPLGILLTILDRATAQRVLRKLHNHANVVAWDHPPGIVWNKHDPLDSQFVTPTETEPPPSRPRHPLQLKIRT